MNRRAGLRRAVVGIVAAVVCAAGITASVRVISADAAGPVFLDGFETGTMSAWTASSGMSVQQQVVYAGSFAARATTTGTPAYAYKNLATPLSELYYDGRFQAISQDPTTTISLVRFRTAAVGAILSILRRSDGKLSYYNETTGVTTIGPAVSLGSWHELEVHVLVNGASSLVEVWLDGTKVVSKTDSLGTTPVGRIYIGDPSSGHTSDDAFDNQLVSTSSDVTPPTAPGNLTGSATGSTSVGLSWTASTDNVGVSGYTIYRNGSALATVGGTTTTYTDNAIVSGQTYTYTVDAFDAAGNHSALSNAVPVTPVSDVQPPTVPTGLQATARSPSRVDLTWNASTDNVGVTGYTIYRNGSQLDVVSAPVTSYTDSSVAAGTQYTYTVDAFDAAANHSDRSTGAVVTTPTLPANTAAPTISGTTTVGQTLTASPGTWSGTPPIGFGYQWRSCDTNGANCSAITGATSSSYVLAQSDAGTTLIVSVTGTNPYGSASADSAATAVVQSPTTAPANTSPPTISGVAQVGQVLTASVGQWTGTPPISYAYQWQGCDSNGANCSPLLGQTTSTYTPTTADVGTTLEVTVTATNAAGSVPANSAPTAVVSQSGTVPSNTSPPTISGSAVAGQTLTASPGSWSGTTPISFSYQWRRCDTSGGGCGDIGSAVNQSYTLAAADVGATVRVVVTAQNSAGSTNATSAQTATVTDSTPPAAPTNLSATAIGANRIDLSWTASTDNVSVAGYTIYRGGAVLATVSGSVTSYSDTTVLASTSYTYNVDAFDSANNHSAQSAAASATTPPPADTVAPTTPTGLTASVVNQNRVDLSWTGSTDNVGVAGYTIYRNGSVLANVGAGTTSYSDLSTAAGTSYSYTVDAFDAAGNHSPASTPATAKTPGTVFSDDFESGNLSAWTSSSGMSVQQQVVYAGSFAARATTTGTPAYAYKNLASPLSELYYDGRFDAISQGSTSTVSLIRFRTAAVGAILSILRRSDGKLSYYNETTGVTTIGPAVSLGSWHELEVHVLVNGASSLIEVWLDGTKVISKTDSLGTTPVGRIYLGDPASGHTSDDVFDSELISTSSDVTPPSVPTGVAAAPIGASRLNVTWNASTDNNQVAGYTVYRNGAAIATVGPNTTGYADVGLSPTTSYSYTVDAFDGSGNRSARSTAIVGQTGAPTSSDPVLAAAGDIACDPVDSRYHGGAGTPGACQELATSNILFNTDEAGVLAMGDNQYEDSTLWKFQQSYDQSWGRVLGLTHPVPGNHEYETQNAAGYFAYFGNAAGDPTKGYYSFDLGTWHIIALNSECEQVGGCGAGSPEEMWLRADLASHSNFCTLAFWHRPRFSSGLHGNDDTYATWWFDLYSAHADIVLNGHDHDYERFAPQSDTAAPVDNGIRAFVVGTGGQEHEAFTTLAANSQVFNNDTFGVLLLTLHPTGYDWQFVPQAGGTFTDSGSGACH